MSDARDPHVLAITTTNCTAATGMSWKWVRRFARAHGVPVWHLAAKPIIPARALLDAMASAAALVEDARSFDDQLADEMRDFTREISISTKPK